MHQRDPGRNCGAFATASLDDLQSRAEASLPSDIQDRVKAQKSPARDIGAPGYQE
jgi:hypothetical protein